MAVQQNFNICNDNVLEWYTNSKQVSATFSQRKWVTKIRKLAQDDPAVQILAENEDGSIFAHLPIGYIKISKPRKRELTEEEKAAAAARLKEAREKKNAQKG